MKISSFFGVALASLIIVGSSSQAKAQFGMSIGNPLSGGLVIGNNYGGYGYGAPMAPVYSGYAPAGVPSYYNSGYAGYAPVVTTTRYVYPSYGYGVAAPGYYRAPVYPRYINRGYGGRRYWR